MSNQNDTSPFEMEVVLLQEGWWDLSGEILQDIARRAFRKKIRVSDVDDEDKKKKKPRGEDNDWIVAGFPMFSVNYRGVLFMIFTIPEPFFEDRAAAAESANELRLAKAIREHDTHVTVKMMDNGSGLDEDERQRLFGRFLAYFTWYPQTRAIFLPAKGLGRSWDKKLRKALRDMPAMEALLRVPGTEEPATRVMPSDEDIQQATAEARQRWPEFLAAYARRGEDQEFFVKAPFKDGEHTEHMWTQVVALEEEFVVARVMNDPVDLTKFKKGTKVRFRNKILSDWFYGTKGGEVVGLFVEKLLHRKHKEDVERRLGTEAEDDLDADDFDEEGAGPPPAAEAEERVQARPPATPARAAFREPVRSERRAPRERPAGMGLSPLVIGGICLLALVVFGVATFLVVRALQPGDEPGPGPAPGGGGGPVAQGGGPKRQGGNSGGHIMRNFVEALDRKDLRAAYDSTSTAFQQRQPFADFERAVRAHKILEGPKPLSVGWSGPDAQGRQPAEVRFDRTPGNIPPLLRAICLSDETGWWVDQIEWVPAAAEQALAQLRKANEPQRRGGNSNDGIMNLFLQALQRGDLRAAYDTTSLAYQKGQPFADFERAVRDSKILDGPRPLRVSWKGRDAQGREVGEVRFERIPPALPPVVKAASRPDPGGTGWWIEELEWPAGAGEQALAYLKVQDDARKAKEARKEGPPNSPFGVARRFVELLEQGDLTGAYALTTKAYRARVARPQFDAAVAGNAALQKKAKLGVYAGGSGVTIPYTVRPADQPPQTPPAFVVRVQQEGGRWLVEEIDWRKP
jgi:uncharacterized protein YegJ (DUF2314 family)